MHAAVDALNARIDGLDARIDGLDALMQNQFAEMRAEVRAELQRTTAEIVKWVAGIIASGVMLAVTLGTFVLNNAAPVTINVPPPAVSAAPAGATK